jgi:molybdopterin/thiamine biosynthesis adenylyltransferase
MTTLARPRLKPALRRIIRDDRTMQFGVHPQRAVVVRDLEPAVRALIESLDGSRDLRQVLAEAARQGIDAGQARQLLTLLRGRGMLDDAAVSPLRALPVAERDRLQPDLDALSLAPEVTDGGQATLRRRHRAQVRIYGAGRVGAQLVGLLAASGVGHLCVVDPAPTRRRDVVPGGLGFDDVGARREDGAVAAARRIAPGVNAWTSARASHLADSAGRPDLVVLAPVEPLDAVLAGELVALRVPHLLSTAGEGFGSVGPLVLPGRTACLHCIELVRRDRDPEWPVVSARLGGLTAGEVACDSVLATLVAAETCGHALAWIDGRPAGVTNSTLDVLPDWSWRRRSWHRHAQCRCFRN